MLHISSYVTSLCFRYIKIRRKALAFLRAAAGKQGLFSYLRDIFNVPDSFSSVTHYRAR
nr:MAG TPA: hypothetical protein [Caudoviricetes sp.]